MKKVIVLFFVSIVGIGMVNAQQNPNKGYQVILSGDAWRYIIDNLSNRPMKEVFTVVTSISTQINAQDLKMDTTSAFAIKPKTDSVSIHKKKNNK